MLREDNFELFLQTLKHFNEIPKESYSTEIWQYIQRFSHEITDYATQNQFHFDNFQ